MHTIHTIGHSTHPIEAFIALLQGARIATLADVRSVPASRWNPQFNRAALDRALRAACIEYVWLGRELGGHPADPAVMRGGKADYRLLAVSDAFRTGLARVKALARGAPTAIMCAEKEPLNCHRTLFVAPALAAEGVAIKHILAGGGIEDHASVLARLAAKVEVQEGDLFDGVRSSLPTR